MKIWKLTSDVYAIKEYLDKQLFNQLLNLAGVSYNQKQWRIEFTSDKLKQVKEYVDEVKIIQGADLLDRLYRINKYKSRTGLMKNSVVLYEANGYIYFLLQEEGFNIREDYEGTLVVADQEKIKKYAQECIYFNDREKLIRHQLQEESSVKDIIDVIDNEEGSFLFSDADSTPFLFTSEYYDLNLTNEDKETLFKKEVEKRKVDAFSLERLAERRNILREIWYPILKKLVEEEINLRQFKLEELVKKQGIAGLFADDKIVELGIELDKLTKKIDKTLADYLDQKVVEEYQQEKERRLYGIE
ncbi:hypothetical protein [Halanaerobaculum tunisiense]